MSMTGLDVFDHTVQKTNEWLKEILYELNWEDRRRAYLALRAVLHALRDRLTIREVVDLGAQLPLLMRGMYYEGWTAGGKPQKIRTREDFLNRVRENFPGQEGIDPEAITRVVFKQLALRISRGEMKDIQEILPKKLRELWPSEYL